ncbi:hypothetical protein BGZ65_001037 [Modicella reniformis]|uniref:Uncharacterized protein n=1 Tax=Modicella reniformis TaxID=1440133 RepID=A0A9P6SPQ4_9FUNG|nr:hypothetical protein BGZ65_001037 [Modicella reniformis]
MHQTQLLLQQQPVPFFPPPAAVVPPQTTSTELTSAQARTATPEPNCIFLPGDISRPLLGQGLFKIVPDAEDEEEARRGASATGRIINGSSSGGAADSRLPLDLDLNFGGDLLNSVITYENQDERFRALEAKQVGDQRQKKGLSQSFQQLQLAPRNASQEVVIVGSDIVLEPLPSAKAAAKASATASHDPRVTTSETNKEVGSTTTTLQSQGEDRHDNQQSNNSNNGKGAIKPRLTRHPTIGAILPTMGTEEYLERTHDKEEYSYGVHGDRRSNAGSIMDLSMTSVVVHPPTRTELCQAAQGDILGTVAVEIPSPVGISAADQDAITSPSLVATSLPPTAATAAVVPPPLARATKPKLK